MQSIVAIDRGLHTEVSNLGAPRIDRFSTFGIVSAGQQHFLRGNPWEALERLELIGDGGREMIDPLDPIDALVNNSPHPLEATIKETEKYQRREKIPPFLRGAELLRILQTGMVMEGSDLAERVGVDKRTLRRYVAYLRDLGFVIEAKTGASGRYVLGAGDIMPPLTFTDDELEVLILALASVGYPGDELVGRAGALSQRIKKFLPVAQRQGLEVAARRRYYDTLKMWGAYDREQKAQGAENAGTES